jgi:hypothetical protein
VVLQIVTHFQVLDHRNPQFLQRKTLLALSHSFISDFNIGT